MKSVVPLRKDFPRTFRGLFLLGCFLVGLGTLWQLDLRRSIASELARDWRDVQRKREINLQTARDQLLNRLRTIENAEQKRPYYHYQNLFRDPRSVSIGPSVAPSPLADGPSDSWVAGYFQVETDGRVTSPAINDELPELTNQNVFAQQSRLRDLLAKQVEKESPKRRSEPVAKEISQQVAQQQAIQVQLSPDIYAQNALPNQVFTAVQKKAGPTISGVAKTGDVTVTVGPFGWEAWPLENRPTLVLARQIEEPSASKRQLVVIDPREIDNVLKEQFAEIPSKLAPADQISNDWLSTDLGLANLRVAIASAQPSEFSTMVDQRWGAYRQTTGLVVALCIGLLWGLGALLYKSEKLARERSRFAATAAHELRTPVAGIVLYADMLSQKLGHPEKQQEYAERISHEAARLGRLIGNILGFSQLERQTLDLPQSNVEIAGWLERAIQNLEAMLHTTGMTISNEVRHVATVKTNPDALERILSNLVENAEKYSRGRKDRRVLIRTEELPDSIVIYVADNGPGMPTGKDQDAFKAFWRGKKPGDPEGLGLGLAVAQAFAKAMGCKLTLCDAPNPACKETWPGAWFSLQIPKTPEV